MALTTQTVNDTLYYPDGTPMAGAFITFTLVGTGTSPEDSGTIPSSTYTETTSSGGFFSVNLWPNVLGYAGTNYKVEVSYTDTTTGKYVTKKVGTIQVPDVAGPHDLSELLEDNVVAGGAFYLGVITQEQYDTVLNVQANADIATLAALAAGAPLVTELTSPVPADDTIELLQTTSGTQVWEVQTGTWVQIGWLGTPVFPTIAAMALAEGMIDGQYADVEGGFNGEKERFQYDSGGIITADDALVVDGVGGQWVSKRTVYADFAEFIGDRRTFAAGTVLSVPNQNDRKAIATGEGHGVVNAGGQEFLIKPNEQGTYLNTSFGMIDGIPLGFDPAASIVSGQPNYTEERAWMAENDAAMRLWCAACIADGVSATVPAGYFNTGLNSNWQFRQSGASPVGLLDMKGITLYINPLATIATDGGDVLQLNAIKNFRVLCLGQITATGVTSSGAGSNGCSVTNGGDELDLVIRGYNLRHVDVGPNIDGGKMATIQPNNSVNPLGRIRIVAHAVGCAYASGIDFDLVHISGKKPAIDIQVYAERCFSAFVGSAGAAASTVPVDMTMGMKVHGHAVNCQSDVILSRCYGIKVAMQVSTTETAAVRRLDPVYNDPWWAANTTVQALNCTGSHYVNADISGNKGECDYKASIGGATINGGLNGATSFSTLKLDIGGEAATADILAVNSGGNIVRDSIIEISPRTTDAIPALFLTPAYGNQVVYGSDSLMTDLQIRGKLTFAWSDNESNFQEVFRSGSAVALKQTAASSPTTKVLEVQDNAGTAKAGFLNNGGVMTDARETNAAALTNKVGNMLLYDGSGTLIGKIPYYSS